jgi:ABC-type dipeptide/oligopeptide/nickel transport system permease component
VCVLLLLIFSVKLKILPAIGFKGLSHPEYLVMPCIASGYRLMAQMTRMGRSGMIDVLGEDYITATYARGISKRKVYTKYAFKNALIPVMTIYGLNISNMLSGAVVIETSFDIPGIGSMLVNAVNHRDYALVQSTLVVTSILFALVNLVVDIINSFIDRRMQLN